VFTAHQYAPGDYTNQPNDFAVNDCWKNKGKKCKDVKEPVLFDDGVRQTLNNRYVWMNGFKTRNSVQVAVNEFGSYRWAGVRNGNECDKGEGCHDSDLYFQYETDLLERLGANHALWIWESNDEVGHDEFNFRHGQNPKNHDNVINGTKDNLIEAIKINWGKNTVFATDETLNRFPLSCDQ
jgi:hypothetical protein